jgi:hypothetical protein
MLGGMFSGASSFASLFGGGEQSDAANEYLAITQSFDFTLDLLRKHKLNAHFTRKGWRSKLFGDRPLTDWSLYQLVSGRLNVSYDSDAGNLTLTFIDPDPAMAQKIVGFYLEDLRDRERRDEAEAASSALSALREEARHSSDPMLQSQLYQISAVQLEISKAATAQSDFAFKEIEKPFSPEAPSRPQPLLDTALAGTAAVLFICLFIVAREIFTHIEDEYKRAETMKARPFVQRRMGGVPSVFEKNRSVDDSIGSS